MLNTHSYLKDRKNCWRCLTPLNLIWHCFGNWSNTLKISGRPAVYNHELSDMHQAVITKGIWLVNICTDLLTKRRVICHAADKGRQVKPIYRAPVSSRLADGVQYRRSPAMTDHSIWCYHLSDIHRRRLHLNSSLVRSPFWSFKPVTAAAIATSAEPTLWVSAPLRLTTLSESSDDAWLFKVSSPRAYYHVSRERLTATGSIIFHPAVQTRFYSAGSKIAS